MSGSTFTSQELLAAATEDSDCTVVITKVMRIDSRSLQKFSVDGKFIYPGQAVIYVPPRKP